ncbi:hypothetical protein QUF50_08660 [Thiotrichales bacterium HSG1]|nr:hypothetical protein [Thiotrichales bacterium HSG1]
MKDYQSDGLKALKQLNFKGRSSELNSHAISLEEYFQKHLPQNTAETVGHGPITLVLDNVSYQKFRLIWRYAQILGIELLYLPSYMGQ